MAGIGTRLLELEIDGENYTAEVSKAVITSGEGDTDFVTFADAKAGGKREYRLELTIVQDAETGSLWDKVWSAAGTTVPFSVNPYGNEVPSPAQPHFTGNATITEPDGDLIGGEADASTTARNVIEVSWVCDGKPVKKTAA